MIQSISFQNFRGFKNLELKDLAQITLLSGKNNAGKSTVLEGIFLLMDHYNPDCFRKICNFRGLPTIPDFDLLWKPLFHQLNTDDPIQISVRLGHHTELLDTELTYYREDAYSPMSQNLNEKTPEARDRFMFSTQNGSALGFTFKQQSYTETGRFIAAPDAINLNINTSFPDNQKKPMLFTQMINSAVTAFSSPIELFGKLELDGKKDEVLDILKKMDPVLSDITTITASGQTQLYGNMDGKLLPMHLAGEGMNRLLFIMLVMMENPDSIVLMDEIENGFHYSMHPIIWEAIANAAQKYHCQVIATTHSYECVAGAVEGIEKTNMKDNFCFFRMAQEKNGRCAYRFSSDLIRTALNAEMEVR